MDQQIEQLTHEVKKRFGLDHYYLKRHHYFYETQNQQTTYSLSMEWFPNGHGEIDEDVNPAGTVAIEMDVHTKAIKSIVFVQGTSFVVDGDFPTHDTEKVIEWVEKLTGLVFGRQFQLVSEGDGAYTFQAVVDNIPVYPPGTINVEFNEKNQLTMFYIDGVFPEEDAVHWEPFSLTPENTYETAKDQCKLIEFPYEPEEKWVPVYGLEEIFLTNDGKTTIPCEVISINETAIKKDMIMEWDSPLDQQFIGEEIDFSSEVTEETALLNRPHPDSTVLSKFEQVTCVEEVRNFLRRVYPDDSGKWILKTLYRHNGYINAVLRPLEVNHQVFQRKLSLIMDCKQYNVINYIDNQMMLDMFGDYQKAEKAVLSRDEAYQKLREHVTVTPRYVYAEDGYILCGKIDCDYGVHAVTGEVIPLDEF